MLDTPKHFLSSLAERFTASPLLQSSPADDIMKPAQDLVDTASKAVMLIVYALVIVILVPVAVFVIRRVVAEMKLRKIKGIQEETLEQARKLEQKGSYAAAAALYEKLKSPKKAALLYEQGRDFGKAAWMYEALGQTDKAVELFKRAGESLRAAQLCVRGGRYKEAAEIFENKGDRLRAAQALEMGGDRPGAAQRYQAAGEYLRAAKLYKDMHMYGEAAEMARLAIGGEELSPSNMEKYYTQAALLLMQGEEEKAAEIFRSIVQLDSNFKDVTSKLAAIAARREEQAGRPADSVTAAGPEEVEFVDISAPEPVTPEPPETMAPEPAAEVLDAPAATAAEVDDIDALIESELEKRDVRASSASGAAPALNPGETTLRGIMKSGMMESHYSMRLWVQVLRTLAKDHAQNLYYGCVPPEAIVVDMQNNIRILPHEGCHAPYAAPEVLAGSPPDEQADIYAMGAVLYELITGTTEGMESGAPSDHVKEVPEWLDVLILKCTERERENRFRSLEEIYARLIELREKI